MTRVKGNHCKLQKNRKIQVRARESRRAVRLAPPSSPPLPPQEDPIEVALREAEDWLLGEGEGTPYKTTCRLFKMPDTLSERLRKRARKWKTMKLNERGGYNTHGGNNRVLLPWQEEAIIQYIREQARPGNWGASFAMVKEAIAFLQSQESPPKPRPSDIWFEKWYQGLRERGILHTIITKPIAMTRLESHTEDDICKWFQEYRQTLHKFKINNARYVYNMDETGARAACPTGEKVIVPCNIRELYVGSPENRKSLTICETIRADGKYLPAFIIAPGIKIMDSWVTPECDNEDYITQTDTGYTSNEKILEYLALSIRGPALLDDGGFFYVMATLHTNSMILRGKLLRIISLSLPTHHTKLTLYNPLTSSALHSGRRTRIR